MARVDTHNDVDWVGMAGKAGFRAARLAQMLNLSRRQLQRHTREFLGRSAQAWLDEQRMIAAPGVLRKLGLVKAAATELGFKQCSHFSRLFKLHYGLWPVEFLANPDRLSANGCQNRPEERIATAPISEA
jgi:transcriptional regulator GlxA family with amidase domain